jgi:hypothetical protein
MFFDENKNEINPSGKRFRYGQLTREQKERTKNLLNKGSRKSILYILYYHQL